MCQIRATMIHECNFNKEEFMNDDLREELRSEIEDFRTQTKRFLDKELNVKEFKGYSGGFGSYAQRGATSFMLRPLIIGMAAPIMVMMTPMPPAVKKVEASSFGVMAILGPATRNIV